MTGRTTNHYTKRAQCQAWLDIWPVVYIELVCQLVTKKDGGHEREICDHCLGTGHKSTVCMRRYFGLPKRVKAAATLSLVTEENFDILHIDSLQIQAANNSAESTPTKDQDASTLAATATVDHDFMAKLVAQQKELEKLLNFYHFRHYLIRLA